MAKRMKITIEMNVPETLTRAAFNEYVTEKFFNAAAGISGALVYLSTEEIIGGRETSTHFLTRGTS